VDRETTTALRETHPGLRTWRDPLDGTLYAWFADGRAELPEGFSEVTVRVDEAPSIFKRMLMDAVEARFEQLGFERKRFAFVNYGAGSLMGKVPSLAAAEREPIGIYPKLVPRVHYTWNTSGRLIMGLVIDVLYTTRLDVPAAEWVAAGLQADLKNAYVVLLPDAPEAEAHPHLAGRSLGRVELIRGDRVRLTDPRDVDLTELPLTSVAPEPTRMNLAAYLRAHHRAAWEKGKRPLRRRLDELVRPRRRHQLANAAVFERLMKNMPDGIPVHGGLSVRFEQMLRVGGSQVPVTSLREPEYSFDPVERRVARRVDVGLKAYGPFDHRGAHRSARVLVVALEENRREVEAAFRKFEAGIKTRDKVFGGLMPMYRLAGLNVTYAFAPKTGSREMVRYADATTEAIRSAESRGKGQSKFDLVVTVTHARFRDLPDSENPYFQTKALALVLDGVPTQSVTIEKLRLRDDALQYVLNTMALACYAKLGGTSHVLNVVSQEDDATELVFGIGRAMIGVDRHAGREETIGFATVFRANGQYLYNDCTPYCERDNYEVALEETIKNAVDSVARFEGLEDGAKLRLIFHVPRRPGKHEERAVVNAMGKLPRFEVDFALVHVNDDHHFHSFDLGNPKGKGRWREKPEAALMTRRGLCMALGPDERLLTFVGTDQYRGYGSPGPLLVRLDGRSTMKDIDYIAQQLYLMSSMNMGSLNPGVAPATITYAEKLARLTGHLRGVQQWTVDLIHQKLSRKLWFV
jgi:hypothetical protein